MSTTDIESEIYRFWYEDFKINVAAAQAPAVPISFPNEEFKPPVDEIWMEFIYNLSTTSEKIARGTYRKVGIVTAFLHFPLNQGLNPSNALAKFIIDRYQDARWKTKFLDGADIISSAGPILEVTSCGTNGSGFKNGAYWDSQVDINFRIETSNLGEITTS